MKREDVRDEVLGSLLRQAAQSASLRDPHREKTEPQPEDRQNPRPARPPRWALIPAVAAAAAFAVILPALAVRLEGRERIHAAAEDLSRVLILESPPLMPELPAPSGVESAAQDFVQSLWPSGGQF